LGLLYNQGKNILDSQIEKLIEERQLARKTKDFKKADSIRDQLKEMGIILEDTSAGVKWKKI
jgi:cysteinyl-tRNA synthetase